MSEDVYLDFERDLRIALRKRFDYPSDCVFDVGTHYYTQAGQKFYDAYCEMPFDEFHELEIPNAYKLQCGYEMDIAKKNIAIRRSIELGNIGLWVEYLEELCPKPVVIYAYGQSRMNDLDVELLMRSEVATEIYQRYPNLELAEDHLKVLEDASIYGGYPIEAILKAIEVGGHTVNPEIPWKIWKDTAEYNKFME